MSDRFLNISQLAEVTRKDRATVRKLLQNLEPYSQTEKEKIYFAPVALALIMNANGSYWKEVILNLIHEKVLTINPNK